MSRGMPLIAGKAFYEMSPDNSVPADTGIYDEVYDELTLPLQNVCQPRVQVHAAWHSDCVLMMFK